MKDKFCESCGMPMKNTIDFGGKILENKYCRYCTDDSGNLKSFEEKVKDIKGLLMKTNNLEEEQAIKMAKEKLKQFPAWKDI